MIKPLVIFILSYLTWIFLTFSLDFQELLAGLIVSIIVTYFTVNLIVFESAKKGKPLGILWIPIYIIIWIYEEVLAHLDVCYRIITGRIKPAILKVDTKLESETGRTLLANSITLTPGTLSMTVGEYLYVHHLHMDKKTPPSFERMGKRICI